MLEHPRRVPPCGLSENHEGRNPPERPWHTESKDVIPFRELLPVWSLAQDQPVEFVTSYDKISPEMDRECGKPFIVV